MLWMQQFPLAYTRSDAQLPEGFYVNDAYHKPAINYYPFCCPSCLAATMSPPSTLMDWMEYDEPKTLAKQNCRSVSKALTGYSLSMT